MATTTGITAATTDTSAASAAMKKSLGLNKDDFLKLFISQLKYQDPLKPQDASAMLDQLSQLSLVEQSYNNTSALNNLLTAQNNATTMNSVGFIGKDVKANGNSIAFDGSTPTTFEFSLPSAVDTAAVTITDASGKVVATSSLGALNSGDSILSWDGRDGNGAFLPAGAYTFKIDGTAAGVAVAATTYTSGRIDGVNIVNGVPQLAIGAVSVAMSDIINVKGV